MGLPTLLHHSEDGYQLLLLGVYQEGSIVLGDKLQVVVGLCAADLEFVLVWDQVLNVFLRNVSGSEYGGLSYLPLGGSL